MSLLQFCENDAERKVIEAYDQYGSDRKAAVALNCGKTHIGDVRRRVQERAANQDYYDTAPDGYIVKGISQLLDSDGNSKLTWVKTSLDHKRQYELWQEAVQGLVGSLPKFEPVESPTSVKDELLVVYPVGDMHLGMLAWDEETGENWDTKRGEGMLCAAMDHLLETSVGSEKALIALLGDMFHYQGQPTTERNGHVLDTDTRFAKIVRVVMTATRYLISRALEKHSEVTVICELGNHDEYASMFLSEALYHIYENEPRVTIDRSPSKFHYYRFGKVLIGTHHGDTVKKPDQLPLIMANDRAKDWGETEYRYWLTGHVHHQSLKDFVGCSVESFRILPPVEAYAHAAGYRAPSDMKSITYHREFGEIARSTFSPRML